jgi:tellurite resistance protein TehA-like permease
MNWFTPTLVMGILTIVLYGASWIVRLMHWPGYSMLRIAAIGSFVFGMVLLVIYNLSKKKEREKDDFDDWLDRDD